MQIGLFFKEFIEEHIKYTFKGFTAIVATKAVFYRIFGYCTFSLRTVSFNGHTFISLFTSILGILYVLYLSEFLCRLALRFKRKLPELISLRTVSFNGHTFISLFTSILGILYVLYLSEFLCRLALRFKRKLPELINFIGNNTWSIMIHHLLIKWLLTQFADTGILGNSRELFDYFISPHRNTRKLKRTI